MAKGDSTGSQLEAAADGATATEAFELLSNETRLAILLALWEAFDPFPEGRWDPTDGNAVSFTELRDRVGVRQGAQFNYHLDKLVGEFVRKTDDGYELLPAGNTIVRTIIGIAGTEEAMLEATEIDLPCPICGASTAITYQNQRLYRVCTACDGYVGASDNHPSGVLMATLANPAGLGNRTPEAIFAAIRTMIYHQYALRVAGICPECSGKVESRLHVCDAHDPATDGACPSCSRLYNPAVRIVCTVCKHWNTTTPAEISMRHPAVAAFCWEHGIELGYDSQDTARWLANLCFSPDNAQETATGENVDQELVSTDPPRVRVTIRYEDDELRLTLDEAVNVIEVDEGD